VARVVTAAARPTAAMPWNVPVGPQRRFEVVRADLAVARRAKSALGGTVNDVVLSVVAGGLRSYLLRRGEEVPDDLTVRTMVPVSVRDDSERMQLGNRVSAMFADLPVGIADPVERLTSIRTQMNHLKDSKQAVAGEVLTSMTGFAPPMLLALGTRLAARLPQRNINTVTTNVPGPQVQLYAAGRPMVEAFPYVPLMGWVRIGVAIFSYQGSLTYGVTGDYDSAEDLDVLCRGVEHGLAELVKEVEGSA
jgi:WS/DGAT/MGAT family acyltransferase